MDLATGCALSPQEPRTKNWEQTTTATRIGRGSFTPLASTDFGNLDVDRLAERIADEIWGLVTGGDSFAKATTGSPIVRAADGIGANIAQGCGHGWHADHQRFVRTARGSLNEARHWRRRAYQRKLLSASEVNRLKPMIRESGPRLNAYLNPIGRCPPAPAKNQQPGTRNQEQ